MATDRTFDEIVLSRRRLLGTAAGAAAGAMFATGALPSLAAAPCSPRMGRRSSTPPGPGRPSRRVTST